MTDLEYRILLYVKEQCDMFRPPFHHHIRIRFMPESTVHVVNSLWSRGYISRTAYGRKGAHRPFLITDLGRKAVSPGMVG